MRLNRCARKLQPCVARRARSRSGHRECVWGISSVGVEERTDRDFLGVLPGTVVSIAEKVFLVGQGSEVSADIGGVGRECRAALGDAWHDRPGPAGDCFVDDPFENVTSSSRQSLQARVGEGGSELVDLVVSQRRSADAVVLLLGVVPGGTPFCCARAQGDRARNRQVHNRYAGTWKCYHP